jgi:hypothetical protein
LEQFLQYLDELDDLASMVGLLAERVRSLILTLITLGVWLAIQIGGIALALSHPPLALATALLMFVGLLYRSVTVPFRTTHQ